ncbi:MAG: DNRLRE domain-containing protein [Chloroflexota bacterium]
MAHRWPKQPAQIFLIVAILLASLHVTPAHALAAPTPIAPADGSTTTAADTPPLGIPEFQWTAVTGATSYRLQISSDIAFTTQIVNVTTPNTSYTPISVSAFPDGTWYWRVRVEAPTPVGDYSSIWSFTKQWAAPANLPTLAAPADAETLDFYDQPAFSWSAVMGASRYKLQIYSSPGGWLTPAYTATTLATTHQPNTKLANGNYYWRVVPLDPGNREGTPSEERSFTTGYNPIPALLEPDDWATPTFTPTFRWAAVRGAQFYRLQYTTDPSFSSDVTQIDTRNTSYTPTATLANDVNYYWRVRVHSGNSISDWTPVRTFIKRWYIKPVLLTPTNLYQHVRFPLFSWTPVPGASYYKVDLSLFSNFSNIYSTANTSNTFFTPDSYSGADTINYWRVTPYDGNGNPGVPSNTWSYRSYQGSVAPHQVYPLFYYPPDTYAGYPGVTTNPHEDRTVALPIFIWHRVYVPVGEANQGEVYAEAYRLQVSTDPTFFVVDWSVDTENTTAAPTSSNPFTPLPNTDYYWRVRPLIGGVEVGEWSQRWQTRFDPALGLTPTGGAAPELIRPTNGFEFAEATPLLQWFPLGGASSYEVQISLDQGFGSLVDTATVNYPAYAPSQSLAQRSLGAVNFGVYYWRVRETGGSWSDTRRFQIAAQSQWRYSSTSLLGDAGNRLQIGSDPASDVADPDYDVTSLQVRQADTYWYFGFHVPPAPGKNVTYALYLDLDHQYASGATFDAKSYTVTTVAAFRPEYAVYVFQEAGAFAANRVHLYRWNGSGWDTVNVLSDIGGAIYYNSGYVELELPNTAIGYQDTTGSYAVSLLSLPAGSGEPQDSVPSDASVPGPGPVSRFANVTERMNLVAPPNDAGVDPTTYPSVLPFFWDWPVLAPWSGAYMKAYLDPLFTTEVATYTLTSTGAYYAMSSHSWGDDFNGDNTYYWRIQPRYRVGGTLPNGAWSQGWRFERQGFIPQNLQTSVTFATPTFTWDRVEGAQHYELQVDDDPNFASPAISTTTRQNSYTHTSTLANATYYWRVRANRYGGVINNWTSNQSFTLALPAPAGLGHIPSGVVGRAPTLYWTPLIMDSPSGDPVLAAWKYRVQVSKDPTFSAIFDSIDTEQSSWTPIKGYDDGQYYWRVAILDGDGDLGGYSPYETFTKQYPVTTLVSPPNGETVTSTPTFVWTPVNGAARYKLEVSQFPTFSPGYETIETDSTRYTPTKVYATGFTYYWRVAIKDNDGKYGPYVDATIILPPPGPSVVSSVRVHASPTKRTSVQFTVTFSEAVTGVDKTDFSLSPTVTGAAVSTVAGSGATYTVTVSTGTGSGTLKLNVLDDDTIKDADLNPLGGGYTAGESYTVDKVAPKVSSSTRVNPSPTARASVKFTVKFSESVTGVDKTDFSLTKTGSITGASVASVTGTGATYTVSVNTGSGNGTLRLNVLDDNSIKDAALNPLNGGYTGGQTYTVDKNVTFNSIAAQDGWVLEKSQNANTGGSKNSTSVLRLGDDKLKKQYRSILSFNTSSLPDNAVITKITLKVKKQGITGGGNPVTAFQGFMVDIKKGILGTSALQTTDFKTAASKTYGPFKPTVVSGWYSINLTAGKAYINKLASSGGLTQIRLRFKLDNNNNGVANFLSLYSGNATAASRPQLIIEYYVP